MKQYPACQRIDLNNKREARSVWTQLIRALEKRAVSATDKTDTQELHFSVRISNDTLPKAP